MTTTLLLTAVFMVLIAVGVPIAYSMGISTIFLLIYLDVPIEVFLTRVVASLNSSALLAIPFFILAGELLTTGGISKRLIDFAHACLGWVRGGLGLVNVGAMAMMSGMSGSGTADATAVGGVIIPAMKKEGYRPGFAGALTAAAAMLGPIIPPSIVLVLYGGITDLSISALVLAGILPGVVIVIILMTYAYVAGRKQAPDPTPFSIVTLVRQTGRSFWGLLLPLFLVVGMLLGWFTATEGGVIVVAYAAVVSLLIYREMTWRDVGPALARTAVLSGLLMLLVGMASGFAWILAFAEVPQNVASWLTQVSDSPAVIMLMVIAFLLILGTIIETTSGAIISVPVLFPLGEEVGYDPLMFAMVIVLTLMIGSITPPVAILNYICAAIARTPVRTVEREIWPIMPVLVACVLIIAFVPPLTTWLPSLAAG